MAAKDITEEQRYEIARLIHAGEETAKNLAKKYNVAAATIGAWKDKYAPKNADNNAVGIDPEDKLAHVVGTHGMQDDEMNTYAEQNGINPQSLAEWHQRAIEGLSDRIEGDFADPIEAMNKAMQQMKRENRALEQRLEKIKAMI